MSVFGSVRFGPTQNRPNMHIKRVNRAEPTEPTQNRTEPNRFGSVSVHFFVKSVLGSRRFGSVRFGSGPLLKKIIHRLCIIFVKFTNNQIMSLNYITFVQKDLLRFLKSKESIHSTLPLCKFNPFNNSPAFSFVFIEEPTCNSNKSF